MPAAAQPVRCGIPAASQLEFFGDATARSAFDSARARLAEVGARAVATDFAPFAETARLLYDGPWVAERYAAVGSFVREQPQSVHPVVRGIIEGAARWSAADAFEGAYRLRGLRRRCEEAWKSMDVMVVPTAGTIYRLEEIAAAPVERNAHLGYYTNFVNLLDLCAVAVPGPFRSDGLPAGVTLIAPAEREPLLLSLGARFHRSLGIAPGAPA
jgi:allophanate hydrolase